MIKHIEIKSDEQGYTKEVYMDGVKINGIRQCTVILEPNALPVVYLMFNPFFCKRRFRKSRSSPTC